MKGLREKFRKNEGFTLVEMLIVVAIIAILIAVSIPLVGSSLEEARHAVDDANYRDAILLADVKYLTDATDDDVLGTYYYVVDEHKQGSLSDKGDSSKATVAACKCDTSGHKGQIISVTIAAEGEITAAWANKSP